MRLLVFLVLDIIAMTPEEGYEEIKFRSGGIFFTKISKPIRRNFNIQKFKYLIAKCLRESECNHK
jgi:hypothetical protein